MPYFFLHSSGRHPVSRGYSIRAHINISAELEVNEERNAGNIYDFRGDRKLAPILAYFQDVGIIRFDM